MTAGGREEGTATTESLLLQGVRETGTELWNDSCGIDDLPYAIANGATGATSNPPIVLGIVRAEGQTWRTRARELAGEHPTWGEGDIAWRLVEEVATRGAGMLAPIHERTGGRQGRQSAQVSPTFYRDAGAMLAQAARLSSLAPNMQVKLPVTTAGLAALEEATYRGIEVNATANFTVAGAIAVAEAVERGLDRREADGIEGALHPVCTLMVGRLDDWVKAVCDRDGVLRDAWPCRMGGRRRLQAGLRDLPGARLPHASPGRCVPSPPRLVTAARRGHDPHHPAGLAALAQRLGPSRGRSNRGAGRPGDPRRAVRAGSGIPARL